MQIFVNLFNKIFNISEKENLIKLIFDSILLFFFVRIFIFETITNHTKSSYTNLHHHEQILVWKLGYNINNYSLPYFGFDANPFSYNFLYNYNNNNIVYYYDENSANYKTGKIIASEDDIFTITNNKIFVNKIFYDICIYKTENISLSIPKDKYLIILEEEGEIQISLINLNQIVGRCLIYLIPTTKDFDSFWHIIYEFPRSIYWSKIFLIIK